MHTHWLPECNISFCNTKVIDIIKELDDYGVHYVVHDPHAEQEDVKQEYNIDLVGQEVLKDLDCIILAVPHDEYRDTYTIEKLNTLYQSDKKVLVDIKGIFDREQCEELNIHYWSL